MRQNQTPSLVALTRRPSPAIAQCQLSYIDRDAIDWVKAGDQHHAYCEALESQGVRVHIIEADAELPDCAFVEDTAVWTGKGFIEARPGPQSRRPEAPLIGRVLKSLGLERIGQVTEPGTLDGGDLLRIDDLTPEPLWLVGRSGRTNPQSIEQFSSLTGQKLTSVDVNGCLHLKTGICYLGDGRFLMNPQWIDRAPIQKLMNTIGRQAQFFEIDPSEPFAANLILINSTTILTALHQSRTCKRLEELGFKVLAVDISEFQKAEAGVTCLSIIFPEESAL